jgi:AraC-like DNA-binding protein
MNMNLKQDDCVKLGIIKDTLDNDYKRHYTYSQLAQKVNTNEFKLKNGFLQLYKISLYAYLTNVRIEKAKMLLSQTEDAIKQIAGKVGFKDTSNFNKNFKKLTGISPSMWRRQNADYIEPAASL